MSGKSAITASIMLFESLLENNVKFGSLNEVITFIDNVRQEEGERQFIDELTLDKAITREECFSKLILACGYRWVPSEREAEIIWEIVSRLDPYNLNRVYYKNNLYEFCNNQKITELIIDILCTLKAPFLDPNHPPKEIKDKIELFLSYIKEYVYYGYLTMDKIDRTETMIRQSVLITDTDSCIISLEHWYKFVLERAKGIDMRIKHTLIEIVKKVKTDDFGDPELIPVITRDDIKYDYDFYNDQITEAKRQINPIYTPPADGFRHSIINIISYCVGQLILDYMNRFTKCYNSWDKNRTCMLIMKNEFLFKSIMLTNGKKNYASIQEVQEGNLVPKEAGLAITGLPLDKVGIPKSTSTALKRILHDQILDADDIDQMGVLKELAILEKNIYKSLINGETKYYKPARIKPFNAYSDPMRIQGIKASVAFNSLKKRMKRQSILIRLIQLSLLRQILLKRL